MHDTHTERDRERVRRGGRVIVYREYYSTIVYQFTQMVFVRITETRV